MKKAWIGVILILALLLAGCGEQDLHPDWPKEWTRFGNLLAVEMPEGFTLGEYNDALSPDGIWYAMFNCGDEPMTLSRGEDEELLYYDAQIFLVLKECDSEEQALANVRDWEKREAEHYELGESRELDAAGQRFTCYPLLSAGDDNPYSRGAAAFAVRGSLAFSVECMCTPDFAGDPQLIAEQFLSGFHYGE